MQGGGGIYSLAHYAIGHPLLRSQATYIEELNVESSVDLLKSEILQRRENVHICKTLRSLFNLFHPLPGHPNVFS